MALAFGPCPAFTICTEPPPPYFVAPDVPADRVAALRKAFMETMKDPELLSEAKRSRLAIDPISGEELQTLAERQFATPMDMVERAKQAMIYKAP